MEQIKEKCPDSIDMIAIGGSFCNGDIYDKSDLDLVIICNDLEKASVLNKCFILDDIGFDIIKLYSSNDLNQTYSLITNGYVSYYDGFIQQDTLESMIASNSDLINLKMYDPGAIGLNFNLENPIFTLDVRKAFQYIFDREELTLASNPYATTSYYPVIGMAPSEAERYMSAEHFNNLPKYEHNTAKAEELGLLQGKCRWKELLR